jgi:hypothetical protein
MALAKFSLRDVFSLVVIVAMALGWWTSHRKLQDELKQASAWRTRAGALEKFVNGLNWDVSWDFQGKSVRLIWQPSESPFFHDPYRHGRVVFPTDSIEPSGDRPPE